MIKQVKVLHIGYRMGRKTVGCLYAGDAVLLAGNEDDLQCLLYRLQIKAETFNMQIYVKKNSINGTKYRNLIT